MSNQKTIFKKNIESILIIDSIYKYLESQISAFDISELLRAEYVLIVSALDYYIHGVVREGLIKQFVDADVTKGNTICVPLATVRVLLDVTSNDERINILEGQLDEITSKYSYQAPQAIEKALGLLNLKKIWTAIGDVCGLPPGDIRTTLSLIIDRRNMIAHEADIDFTSSIKREITANDIEECMAFIKMLVESLDRIISESSISSV